MFMGIGLGLIPQAMTGSSVDALLGGNSLDNYGNAAFLFDVPNSVYRNGTSQVGSFSSLTGLTFTRALAAYAPNSAGELEFFYGPRTNLCLQSQTFDNASWSKTTASVTANATTAPDGTTTADLITRTGTGDAGVNQAITVSASTAYAYSVFVAAASTGFVIIQIGIPGSAGAYFYLNLSTGVISQAATGYGATPPTGISAIIEPAAYGFWRAVLLFTMPAAVTSATPYVKPMSVGTGAGFETTNTGQSCYAWGAQLEVAQNPANPAATDYIPTTSATVTVATQPRITDRGLLIEGARTNKCTNYNAAPQALVTPTTAAAFNAAVSGLAASAGDANALFGVVDDTAELLAAGLQNICTNGRVFKIDNSACAATSSVSVLGATGNTNAHYYSTYGRATAGTGTVGRSASGSGAASISGASYTRVGASLTPAGAAETLRIQAVAGAIVYFILNQLEEGAFVSSPIPVAGASATRPADVCSIAASITAPYTLFAEVDLPLVVANGQVFLGVSDGTSSNGSAIYTSTTSPVVLNKTSGSNDAVVVPAGSISANTVSRLAGRFETNNINGRFNGGNLGTLDTSCTVSSRTQIEIGSAQINALPIFGFIKRAAVWSSAFTDSQLQGVTS